MESHQQIDFCTLGMFIIDDIYPSPTAADQTPQLNVIGGAGTFAAIGARLFSPPPNSKTVGWIVDAGTDFPPELRTIINSWKTGVYLRDRPAPTTRGWNGYSGNEHRSFKYITEKKQLTYTDLTPDLLAAKAFHLICGPPRCIEQVKGILSRRQEVFGPDFPRPVFVWEPFPDLCNPVELEATREALKYVDVFSPNHDELACFFGFAHGEQISKPTLEDHTAIFLQSGIGSEGEGAVVIRAGASGCYVCTASTCQWLPAYHQDASKVVDPTGGGNSFLGGLTVGLARTGFDVVEAARWAAVAASFCIEQTGMPTLQPSADDSKTELWNGANVFDRLEDYRKRTA